MMKKLLVLLLSLLLACTFFTACGEKELADGIYTAEVTLSGGTGRATVESPARVVIENGEAIAAIVWSSPFYEYMIVGDTRYAPVQEEGNSSFEIPVVWDEDIAVSASTIAMSQPYLIDYTLHFHSATLKGAE